jgi:hypothetical protein
MPLYPKTRTELELSCIRDHFIYVGGEHPICRRDGSPPSYIRSRPYGYIQIELYHKGYVFRFALTHVVWYLNTGKWPTLQIDHKDDNNQNNVFENLQELTNYDNKKKAWRSWASKTLA